MEPPGSTTARTPASASISKPSGNGKYASDAATDPAARFPALVTASRAESTRFTCPMPTPTDAPSAASRIALDFTARHAPPRLNPPAARVVARRVDTVPRLRQHPAADRVKFKRRRELGGTVACSAV